MRTKRRIWWQRAAAGYFTGIPSGARADVFELTAHRKARRGDLTLMYANRDQTFVAIGRLLCDPVLAVHGDGKWWTYLQMLAAEHPVPRSSTGLPAREGEFTDLTDDSRAVTAIMSAWRRSNPGLVERL